MANMEFIPSFDDIEEGDAVRVSYESKRSGNRIERTGEVTNKRPAAYTLNIETPEEDKYGDPVVLRVGFGEVSVLRHDGNQRLSKYTSENVVEVTDT